MGGEDNSKLTQMLEDLQQTNNQIAITAGSLPGTIDTYTELQFHKVMNDEPEFK